MIPPALDRRRGGRVWHAVNGDLENFYYAKFDTALTGQYGVFCEMWKRGAGGVLKYSGSVFISDGPWSWGPLTVEDIMEQMATVHGWEELHEAKYD